MIFNQEFILIYAMYNWYIYFSLYLKLHFFLSLRAVYKGQQSEKTDSEIVVTSSACSSLVRQIRSACWLYKKHHIFNYNSIF